jgi:lipoprotein-anchoring transpeptidase ErfK/SrfK
MARRAAAAAALAALALAVGPADAAPAPPPVPPAPPAPPAPAPPAPAPPPAPAAPPAPALPPAPAAPAPAPPAPPPPPTLGQAAPPASPLAGVPVRARMVGVLDAGRIRVRMGGRPAIVRLQGVRPPAARGVRAACLASGARRTLAALAPPGTPLLLAGVTPAPGPGRRIRATVAVQGPSGASPLGRGLVAAGMALPPAGARPPEMAGALRSARRTGAGMWGAGCRLLTTRSVQGRLAELGYLPREAVNGQSDERTRQALIAFQGWENLPRDGVAGASTRAKLVRAARPQPTSGLRGGLEIHTYQQVLLLVKDGRTVRAIHVSTGGPGTPTPHGNFRVTSRQRMSFSRPFEVWMPFALYFVGGIALHEYPDVPPWAASHGCVRMPAGEAEAVFRWAGPGTPVWVGP